MLRGTIKEGLVVIKIKKVSIKKILEGADMTDVDISALINEGAHLNNKELDGDRITRAHATATKIVQQLLNKFL